MPYADPQKAREDARQRYLANREPIIARSAARRARMLIEDPERLHAQESKHAKTHYAKNRDAIIAKQTPKAAKWAAENPERRNAISAAYVQRHPEQRRKTSRANDAKPERKRAHCDREHVRRAQKLGTQTEPVLRQLVWERDEGVCGICHLPADRDDWHLDHVIPLSKGGPHTYGNTQVSHPTCNLSKGGGRRTG